MKRPPSIPPDVWENLTCNDAAEAGLLGSVSKEWLIVGGKALLRDADDSALIARMLEENISHVAIGHACRIVRARKTGDWLDNHIKKNVLKDVKLMARPARIPEDVWDALTVHEAVEADLLGEAALEMAKPETLCRELESGSVLAKCLRQNVDVNRSHGRPSADEILARRVRRIRQMRAEQRDKPNRLRRIPADIWDSMTVREACDHEFFSRPKDGKDLHLNTCLHMFPADSFIGQSISRKLHRLDDRTLEIRFRAIREERAQRMAAQNGYVWKSVPDDRIRGAKADMVLVDDVVVCDRTARCAKHEVYTMNGIAYCSRCDASESELLDGDDPHADEHSDVTSALELASQHIHEASTHGRPVDLAHALRRAVHRAKQQDVRQTFREDICRNDGPLLPPFEAGEPTDRVTVMMLYPYVSQLGEMLPMVRCSIVSSSQPLRNSEFSIKANDPHAYGIRWERNSAWRDLARTALRFDLAVRTGEPLAVSAYGLILFALSGRAEREREQARAVMSAADNAMDAVMRAAREVSEGA